MARIELKGLKKEFAGQGVLSALDLAIEDKEFFTLVGPSGCGKSTVLNLIAGLEAPTDGSVLFDGQEVQDRSPRERDVAMVFQSYALYPHMTVRGNLSFPLEVRGLGRGEIAERVGKVAKLLGLADLLERRPKQLSGGQQQRVALGRALIRSPKVFLMDEPLSNLDAKLRTQTRIEIKRLHRDVPVTTVYVTHDQEEAMSLSDRLAILRGGELQQVGTPAEVYERPANLFAAQFIGKPTMNVLEGTVEAGGVRVGGALLAVGERAAALAGLPGGKVFVGVRPEHVQLSGAGLPAVVEVVEPLGSESWIELQWEGREVLAKTLDRAPQPGEKVALTFPPGRLHFFHPNTEARVAGT